MNSRFVIPIRMPEPPLAPLAGLSALVAFSVTVVYLEKWSGILANVTAETGPCASRRPRLLSIVTFEGEVGELSVMERMPLQ